MLHPADKITGKPPNAVNEEAERPWVWGRGSSLGAALGTPLGIPNNSSAPAAVPARCSLVPAPKSLLSPKRPL